MLQPRDLVQTLSAQRLSPLVTTQNHTKTIFLWPCSLDSVNIVVSFSEKIRDLQVLFDIKKPPHSRQGSNFPLGTKCLVYHVPCKCGTVYVREIGRQIKARLEKHKRAVMKADPNNAIAGHV